MLAFVASLLFIAQAPQAGPSAAELEAMGKLDFLVGRWEGRGTMMMGPGQSHSYQGTETVQRKLQGRALLVEGLFRDESGKTVHETLAVITYDEKVQKYRFRTYLFNQPEGLHELKALDKGFQWKMSTSAGQEITWTMNLTEKGEWHEWGEIALPQGNFKILEMTLKKLP